jgi:hypothetical protein
LLETAVTNTSPLVYLSRTENLHLLESSARNVLRSRGRGCRDPSRARRTGRSRDRRVDVAQGRIRGRSTTGDCSMEPRPRRVRSSSRGWPHPSGPSVALLLVGPLRGWQNLHMKKQVVIEEATDPAEIAAARAQRECSDRNAAFLEAHAQEIYPPVIVASACTSPARTCLSPTARKKSWPSRRPRTQRTTVG